MIIFLLILILLAVIAPDAVGAFIMVALWMALWLVLSVGGMYLLYMAFQAVTGA